MIITYMKYYYLQNKIHLMIFLWSWRGVDANINIHSYIKPHLFPIVVSRYYIRFSTCNEHSTYLAKWLSVAQNPPFPEMWCDGLRTTSPPSWYEHWLVPSLAFSWVRVDSQLMVNIKDITVVTVLTLFFLSSGW